MLCSCQDFIRFALVLLGCIDPFEIEHHIGIEIHAELSKINNIIKTGKVVHFIIPAFSICTLNNKFKMRTRINTYPKFRTYFISFSKIL